MAREDMLMCTRSGFVPQISPLRVCIVVFTFCIAQPTASRRMRSAPLLLFRPTDSIPPTRGLSDHRFPWMTCISGLRDLDPIRIGRGIGSSRRGEQVIPPLPHAATPSRYSPEERVTVTPPRPARASQVRRATSILSASAEASAQAHVGSR